MRPAAIPGWTPTASSSRPTCRDHYDADVDNHDWENVRAECGASIQADSVSESLIANEA
ncbi:hypothetical protein HTS88_12045 [Pseudarthrobacter oxydans]|uniref:hypothetical protein n=1 Tax=Pseudarthrobacter oxydans TaxID=1671 RepID=UPI0015741C68|nr:hypothetical protein [Pseudarthrobacter oxydans]NSX37137.1 hypothetical protein [Pseudarthrobacter oxydans]